MDNKNYCDLPNTFTYTSIKTILKKLIDERIIYLTEHGIDLMDDLELIDMEDLYSMISREIYYQNNPEMRPIV